MNSETFKELSYFFGALGCGLMGVLTLSAAVSVFKNGTRNVERFRKAGYGIGSYFKGSGFRCRVNTDGAVEFESTPPPPSSY